MTHSIPIFYGHRSILLPSRAEIGPCAPCVGGHDAYFFHVRGVTKAGEGNWSQVVSLLMT